jgi:DNA-binding MarR family transcriptional regulator
MNEFSAVPVITLWEEFVGQHKDGNLKAFARWLIHQKERDPKPSSTRSEKKAPDKSAGPRMGDNEKAMYFIYRIQRMMEMKSKPVIKKIGFSKPQEYAMLAEVCLLGNPNKKEVAQKMLLENSTAVEITNRLVQYGYIKETNDPNDKRSTRLSVTDKGMKKLIESHMDLVKIHSSFLDCLDDGQKKEFVKLLWEVEQYHATK